MAVHFYSSIIFIELLMMNMPNVKKNFLPSTGMIRLILFVQMDRIHQTCSDRYWVLCTIEFHSREKRFVWKLSDEFQCIGTTTRNDYEKYIGKDAALDEHFQRILIKETSIDGCVSTLRDIKGRYESCFNGLTNSFLFLGYFKELF